MDDYCVIFKGFENLFIFASQEGPAREGGDELQ